MGDIVPFIYASIIAPVPDVIDNQGGKLERAFCQAGVPVELAEEPERVLPMRDYLTLLETASRETGDELFGVSLAERTQLDDLGPFGRMITGAPTLRGAIGTANRLVHNYAPACRSWLEFEGETVRWHYRLTAMGDRREGGRLDGEYTLMMFRTVIRLAAGPNWQPTEFLLERGSPVNVGLLQSRLGAPVRYEGSNYALVFPRGLLDLPMVYAEPLEEAGRRALLTRLISSRPEDSFVGSAKALIWSHLCGGYPEVSAVARSTDLSLRTFQRRLADEGVAYKDLVAQVRRDMARELLADLSRSQLDISMTLGYSDAANFSRAFKRRAGMTPTQYRKSLTGTLPS